MNPLNSLLLHPYCTALYCPVAHRMPPSSDHLPPPPPAPQVRQLSRLYESAPAYVTDQPPFLNAAALVDTSLPPLDLLRRLKDVEVRLGGCLALAVGFDSL